jgi:hypothetical protein
MRQAAHLDSLLARPLQHEIVCVAKPLSHEAHPSTRATGLGLFLAWALGTRGGGRGDASRTARACRSTAPPSLFHRLLGAKLREEYGTAVEDENASARVLAMQPHGTSVPCLRARVKRAAFTVAAKSGVLACSIPEQLPPTRWASTRATSNKLSGLPSTCMLR